MEQTTNNPCTGWIKWPVKLAAWWVIAVQFAVVMLALGIGFWSHPSADDFGIAWHAEHVGVFNYALGDFYHNWSGRWAASVMGGLPCKFFDLTDVFPWIITGFFLLFLTSIFLFFRSVLFARSSVKQSGIFALGFVAFFWANAPSIAEGFYWLAGYTSYLVGASMLLLSTTWAAHLANGRTDKPKFYELLGLVLLGIWGAGFNELLDIIFGTTLALIGMIAYTRKNPRYLVWLSLSAGILIGFAILYFAPGNKVRIAMFPDHGNLKATILYGIREVSRSLIYWILDRDLILASLVFLTGMGTVALPDWLSRVGMWEKILPPFLTIFALFVIYCGPFWAMGMPAPARTVNLAYLAFLIGWFFTLALLNGNTGSILETHHPTGRLIAVGSMLLFGATLLTGNTRMVAGEIFNGTINQYDQQMNEAYEALDAARDNQDTIVSIPGITARTECFHRSNIQGDPEFWQNAAIAKYWNVKGVVPVWD